MKRVATLVSVYRGDKLSQVEAMMESLYAQRGVSVDIFVCEDGPVPVEIHRYLAEQYRLGKIAFLRERAKNLGLGRTLNELVEIVMPRNEHDFLMRMDADDICRPDRVSIQLEWFEQHPETDILGGWIEEFNEDTGAKKLLKFPEDHEAIRQFFQRRCPMAHVTVMFRRRFFERVRAYPTDNISNEDLALWIVGMRAGLKFANVQTAIVDVRTNNRFYRRRGGYAKAYDDFRLKLRARRELSLGLWTYFYAFVVFVIMLLPPQVKPLFYRSLR